MSKRQQQLEKRSAVFMGEFKKLLYRHRAWEVWSDFCTMAAISIANAADKRHFEAREKLYLDTIKRYTKEEQQVFPVLLAETVMELENNITDVSEYRRNYDGNGAVKQTDGAV